MPCCRAAAADLPACAARCTKCPGDGLVQGLPTLPAALHQLPARHLQGCTVGRVGRHRPRNRQTWHCRSGEQQCHYSLADAAKCVTAVWQTMASQRGIEVAQDLCCMFCSVGDGRHLGGSFSLVVLCSTCCLGAPFGSLGKRAAGCSMLQRAQGASDCELIERTQGLECKTYSKSSPLHSHTPHTGQPGICSSQEYSVAAWSAVAGGACMRATPSALCVVG